MDKGLIWKMVALIFGAIIMFHLGWNLASLYEKDKHPETYCIWQITTNDYSFYPNAIIWEDSVGRNYKEYQILQKVLKEGEIESIDTKCYYFGFNPDGTRIEVKP